MVAKAGELLLDLHVHSSVSGGSFSPSELVAHAIDKGLDIIAITDVGSVEGVEEALRAAEKVGWRSASYRSVRIVSGLELRAFHAGRELLLVGLFVDPDHRVLKEDLLCYRLGIHKFSAIEAIELIRAATGVPILADPASLLNGTGNGIDLLRDELLDLKNRGLMGLEVYRPGYTPKAVAQMESLALDLELARSGGSDFYALTDNQPRMGEVSVPPDVWEELISVAESIPT